ncbi:MAG: AAA family ATPase [Candidatus Micrarchaeota archaeon]
MVETLEFIKNAMLESEEKVISYSRPQKRDLYGIIKLKPNLKVIYGLRGGGKTTLLFQRYLDYEKGKRVYFSGDELVLLKISIYEIFKNLKYAMDLGKDSAVFIDEITKVPNWAEEIKIAYDSNPNLQIYISGSSTIDLVQSKSALARRASYHHLLPMTFREYVKLTRNIELEKFDLFSGDVYTQIIRYDIYLKQKISNPMELFHEYMSKSHPFLLEANQDMIFDLVEKIIYEDIAKLNSFDSSILEKFERLILVLAMSEKTTYENLATDLQVSKAVIGQMLRALIQSGLIKQVLPYGSGRVVGRKSWRYLFVVPAIRELYMKKGGAEASKISGYIKEDVFASHLDEIFYLDTGPDFMYKNIHFEVGGKNKTFEQLEGEKKGFIVYDGFEVIKKDNLIKFPFYIFLAHL